MEIKDIRKYDKSTKISIIQEYLSADFKAYKNKILLFSNASKYLEMEFQKDKILGIFISAETLIKHKEKHPEIRSIDYYKALIYLQKKPLAKKDDGINHKVFFYDDETKKYYRVSIKITKNNEVFLNSLVIGGKKSKIKKEIEKINSLPH